MKSNIKIILSSTALIAALLIVIWKNSSDKTPSAPINHTISSTNKRERATIKNDISGEDRNNKTATSHDDASPSPQDIATKDAIVKKIHGAAITYKAENLPVIKPYLLSSDPEIRQEAVDAMIILGDSTASPMLREAAKQMNTAQDLKIMLEAADYLELPPANTKEIFKNRKNSNEEPPNPSHSE